MRTALLVIDMQNIFHEMCTPDTVPNITKLVSGFRERLLPVIFTHYVHTQEELTPLLYGGNQLVQKWGPEGSIRRGSKQWEFLPEIAETLDPTGDSASDSTVVAKNTYDAFINENLASLLEKGQVETGSDLWCHDRLLLRHERKTCLRPRIRDVDG